MARAAKDRTVFILSDSTGDTASRVVRAALKQFASDEGVSIRRFPNVTHGAEIRTILKAAKRAPTLVAHTFAGGPLRAELEGQAERLGLKALDLLGPLLDAFQSFLNEEPREEMGLLHKLDDDYFRRISAVEYAVMHDDGKNMQGLKHADLVLVGPSRSGKTPLSIYLSLDGWRTGNVPLVIEQALPQALIELPSEKVIGLVLDPRRLAEIRRARLEYIAPGKRMTYDDEDAIRDEVAWFRRVCGRHGWRLVDVTQKAIEESSNEVITALRRAGKGGRKADTGRRDR